jgi:hypothetical protein
VLPGGGDADKLALVGAAVGRSGGHQRALGDHGVDLDAQVGKGLEEPPDELLGLLGVLAPEGVIQPIAGHQLVDGVEVAAVEDLLVEPPHRLLVGLDRHDPLLALLPGPGSPDSDSRTIAEAA